jgi:hypothetical protein
VLIVDLSLYLKTKKLLCVFPLFITNMLSFLQTRLPTISCLYVNHIKELGINSNTSSNTAYKPTSFDRDEVLANHRSFMTSLNIPSGKESEDLPYLYWIPQLHKTPYKERYIVGSSTCSTKELSIHLTKILSAVKEGQQKYCETLLA